MKHKVIYETEDEHIPKELKYKLFGCVGIKARRCFKCYKVVFVNFPEEDQNFFCRECSRDEFRN